MSAMHLRTQKGREAEKTSPLARGNVFARFTLRSLRANRVRTTVTVAGIVLATGLLMAVLASVGSLRTALLDRTRASSGVWQLGFDYTDDGTLDDLRDAAGSHLDRLSTRRDLGAAALSGDAALSGGLYLGVLTVPQEQGGTACAAGDDAFEVYPTPEVIEGRLPERPGEIALPSYLKGRELTPGASAIPGVEASATSKGELELGGEVTLALGRRTLVDDPSTTRDSGSFFAGEIEDEDGGDGTVTISVKNANEGFGDVGEPRVYTVVGFVSTIYSDGDVAYVSAGEPPATASGTDVSSAFFSTTGYSRAGDLSELMWAVLGPDSSWESNGTLLEYQGLGTPRAIFDSLTQIAVILAAVIVVAAVSLISNAFTISISERTRQFGLLSSLGASRRQLRRTVFTEAAVLGAVGIPLGLVVGIVGAAAVFALTAEGWETLIGGGATMRLVVTPSDAALSAGLAVATLVVSALVPAVRASRVPAVDAIRQARDVRPSRRLARVFRRRRDAMDDLSADRRRPRGLAARLGGMPAFLARRTLRVSAGKSRVAALALAVSVALLVTGGLIGEYLSGTLDYVDYGATDLEAYVSEDGGTGDIEESAAIAGANDIVGELGRIDGIERAWALIRVFADVHVGRGDVDWDAVDAYEERQGSPFNLDAEGYGSASVYLLDDATWRTLAGNLGLAAAQADPANLSCVALNAVSVTNESTYGTVSPLTGAGDEVGLLVEGDLAPNQYLGMGDGGRYGLVTMDRDTYERTSFLPAEDLDLEEVRVPVAATTASLGASFPMGVAQFTDTNQLIYLMPVRAVLESDAARALPGTFAVFQASFAGGADEDAVVEDVRAVIDSHDGLTCTGVTNMAGAMREARAMVFTVNVFLYSFTAITMAIAVANVFNTIASGLMLRTREFAALQSAGMGQRAFRRMIALECADFAVKGLLGGIALAAVVDVGVFLALNSSISTLTLIVPWGSVALACAVVVGVLALAAAYALRRTHAMNLVEALRVDAV